MKVFAISDFHLSFSTNKPMDIFGEEWVNHHIKIKESVINEVGKDDVLIIAGDISWALRLADTKEDFEYINSLPGKKIIVRGNHDYWWQSITRVREVAGADIFALQNDAVKIGNYIFFGSRGWTVADKSSTKEDTKIYNREVERMKLAILSAKKLQTNCEILICVTHYPPFNVHFEPSDMTKLFSEAGVDTVVYGHLHGKECKTKDIIVIDGVSYHLTSCDFLKYKVKHIL